MISVKLCFKNPYLLKWIKEKYYSELKPKTVYQGSSTSRPLFIQIFHLKSLHDLCSTFFSVLRSF